MEAFHFLMKKIRVLIADDNPGVRTGIRRLLERSSQIEVVGEVADGYEALEFIKNHHPDILLLDMEMPNLNGLGVLQKLQDIPDPVRVLVLSAYIEKEFVHGVLDYGAAGYLTKDDTVLHLVDTIHRVANGETGLFSPKVRKRMHN